MEPRSDEAVDAQGHATGSPYQVLLQEVQTWCKVWQSDCKQDELEKALKQLTERLRANPEEQEPTTVAHVLQATMIFKERTVAPDG